MARDHSVHHTKAFVMLVLANAYWGLSFPLIKAILLVEHRLCPQASGWFSTNYALAPRFLLGLVVLAALQGRSLGTLTRSEWIQGLWIGGFACFGMLFQSDGLAFTAASTSAFLTQLYAITIPIWLAIRHRRNPGWIVWLSSVLVLVGVGVLGHVDLKTFRLGRGEWETLLCSLFFMGQILWLDDKRYAENRPEKVAFVMFLVEGAFFTAGTLATAPSAAALALPWTDLPWVGLTVILTLVCTVAAYLIMTRWQPILDATEAGLSYCIEPIFSSLMALFLPGIFSLWAAISYPNEHATSSLLIGGALITFANVVVQLRPKKD